ncbi:uncharacterized protein LOC132038075 [Lycium ferocissimum]|uniref:uncharacterized protein LOC132038075 n=1 Tax=Lycium ferocissimum TaxID=112874 RepID=UPI002814AB64|nr:uncharacterized protein LOC132038075 [Lycium ferocissimum]
MRMRSPSIKHGNALQMHEPYVYANDYCQQHKSTIPQTKVLGNTPKFVEERFCSADKSLAGTLMAELTTMKFDGSRSMQNHIIEMTNIVARLRTLGMKVDDSFLVQFILNSLPPEYGPFQINYNTIKEK